MEVHSPYVPVPVSAIFCGLPPPLSLMFTDPERAPVALGANVTVNVQLAPGATLDPQVLVCEKSPAFVPVIEMPVILRVVLPTFVKVELSCELLPTLTLPKLKLPGSNFTTVPVPESGTA